MANLKNVLKTLSEYPGYLLMRSVARFDAVRSSAVWVQSRLRRPVEAFVRQQQQRRSEYFAGVDPAALAAAVDQEGLGMGLTLPPFAVAELMEYARTHHCWAERNPALGFHPAEIEAARSKLGRRFLLACYFNAQRHSPLIARLADDPVLLEIAARYLRTVPRLVGVNMFWSYPEQSDGSSRGQAAQMFHFDLDDFKFIKYFFYLTDVDAEAGPHVVVKGTHRNKRHASFADSLRVRRYTDDEVLKVYGSDRVVSIAGPAGTGFAEDTLCIHKGAPPIRRERLILQIQYALNDFGIQKDEISESRLELI